MKTKFLQLHDMGELIIVNADEIRLVEPYSLDEEEMEDEDELDEDEDELDEDEDLDEEVEKTEKELNEDEEEIEELDEEDESSEDGYKAVISYKGIKNSYTFVDETPEEIWEMLE